MAKKYKKEAVVAFGVEYKTMADACRAYNILQSCVLQRLKRNMTLEEALTAPPEGLTDVCHGGKSIIVNGTTFPSIRAAVKHYGLNYATVSNRLQSPHWTTEEAFEIVPHQAVITHAGSAKPITIGNNQYASIDEACHEYGIPRALVYTRRKRGWSIEETFGIKPRDTSKYGYSSCGRKNAKSITIDGVTFDSIKQAASHYHVKYQTLYWRLKKGISIEDALKMPAENT